MSQTAAAGRRPRRSRLVPAERRQQILATARRLVESGEIRQISVEAVAEHAGVSAGLLFHYFGSQREFRRTVVGEVARDLLAQIEPDPARTPVQQLHAGLETFVASAARTPDLFRTVARTVDEDFVDLHRSMRATLAAWLVAGLSQAGAPMGPAVSITVTGWLAFAEEAVLGWLDDPVMPADALVALCERAFLRLLEAAVPDRGGWEQLTAALNRPGNAPG